MERGEPGPNQADSVNAGKSRNRRHRSVELDSSVAATIVAFAFEAWICLRRRGRLGALFDFTDCA